MEVDIAQWILEFILHHEKNERMIKRFLSILPIGTENDRLKKSILLKSIEFEISDGLLSEKILDLIESIAVIDNSKGIEISESMKDAYCMVAVDCTARVIKGKSNEQSKFINIVKRIWRGRISEVEKSETVGSLVSDFMLNWKDDLEVAVWDTSICENVLMRNTRNEALKAVRVYLAEAKGPTFLELAAEKLSESVMAASHGIGNDDGNCRVGNGVTNLPDAIHMDFGGRNKAVVGDKDHVGKIAENLPDAGRELGLRDKDKFGEQATTLQKLSESVTVLPDMGNDQGNCEVGNRAENLLDGPHMDLDGRNILDVGDKIHIGKRAASLPIAGQGLGERDKDGVEERATTSLQDLDTGIEPATRSKDQVEEVAVSVPGVGQVMDVSNEPAIKAKDQSGKRALPSRWGLDVGSRPAMGDDDAAASPNAPAMRDKSSLAETQKVNGLPERKCVPGHARPSRGGVKIAVTEELNIGTSRNEYDCLTTPVVNKAQEALRSSSMELKAVVKDPLPDALHLAESVIADMKRNEMNHKSSIENRNRIDVDVPSSSVNEGVQSAEANEGNLGSRSSIGGSMQANEGNPRDPCSVDENIQADEGNLGNQCSARGNNEPTPSFMERNSTAHTFEWNDSIDDLLPSPSQSTRLHLPSPKRNVVSPLKAYAPTKRRRIVRKWSVLEEDTLRTGVHNYGKGNWKDILKKYSDIFVGRTEVDLKDKWRNLTRSS